MSGVEQIGLALDALDPSGAAAQDPRDLLADYLGPIGGVIDWTFQAMEWAEEEITAAKARYPERADLLHNAFCLLCPDLERFTTTVVEAVFRAHMRALLDRIGKDGPDADVATGTPADALMALRELALAAPLRPRFYTVYLLAFIDTLGEATAAELFGEDDEGIRRALVDRDRRDVQETYDEIRRAMNDQGRQTTWREKLESAHGHVVRGSAS